MTEMQKLITKLAVAGIPFQVTIQKEFSEKPLQVWYPKQEPACICDVICHSFSYGGPQGYLEIMGLVPEEAGDTVEGWLTAEEVFCRIKNHYDTSH